jgi:hypothetical protein
MGTPQEAPLIEIFVQDNITCDDKRRRLCGEIESVKPCVGSFEVSSSEIAPVAQAGGAAAIDLIEGSEDGQVGSISDRLVLTVEPATGGSNLLSWCWSSDWEQGAVNMCPLPSGVAPAKIPEPVSRGSARSRGGGIPEWRSPDVADLTAFFTEPKGPLVGGGKWLVRYKQDHFTGP